jgi:ABC transport system ATP-binding/permease protein
MPILTLESVRKEYGLEPLFEEVTFALEANEKAGVIGPNGSGKTTLLRIIAGVEPPDSGIVRIEKDRTVGYLSQDPIYDPQATVLEAVFEGGGEVLSRVRDYEEACRALERVGGADDALLRRVTDLAHQLDISNGWDLEADAKAILDRLGIVDTEARMGTLSGGQRKRVALARTLVLHPDLLILDEPTNHLDADTIAWLEEWLSRYAGALLLVTHDRYFLDRVTNRMLEIEQGRVNRFVGNYTAYLEMRAQRDELRDAENRTRENLARRELAWLRRGAKARTTKQKARVDRAHALLETEGPPETRSLELSAASTRLGNKVIEVEGISKAFGDRVLITDFTFRLRKGERWGIIGPNGTGKTTFVELLAGRQLPDEGKVERGETVALAYYDQEGRELDPGLRAIDAVKEVAEWVKTADGDLITAGQMLERFLFTPDEQYTYVGKLSGGERRRLDLLRLLMGAPNVLILDEPTNNFDIPTLVALEDYLDGFGGCLVVVSHDRYFLDRTVDQLLVFGEGGTVGSFPGSYTAYVEDRQRREKEAAAAERERAGARSGGKNGTRTGQGAGVGSGAGKGGHTGGGGGKSAPSAGSRPSAGALSAPPAAAAAPLSWKEQKELERLEGAIARGEARKVEIEAELLRAGADFSLAGPLYEEMKALEATLAGDLQRWEALAERA